MSSDAISRINFLRHLYQAKDAGSASEEVRVLQQIKNELKISNDEKTRDNLAINSATNSPYLPDQLFYKKEVVFNSAEESSWRNVKSADEAQKDAQTAYLESNRRKLNII